MSDIETRNPATGEILEVLAETPAAELERIVERVHAAFLDWRRRPIRERGKPMRRAARLLRERKAAYARTMALEMGKPVVQGEAEAEKCAIACDYYADNAERFVAEEPRESDASRSYLRFEPLGAVLAIMPWNFPFWQVFRFAAPALMAGNAAILKHALNVSRCALDIEALLREAGFPDHLLRAILVDHERVPPLIADPRVQAVTLTGSERAGSQVAGEAGRALKKSVLELGGSDPFIVLEDADLERAVETAATARLQNSGQSCIAAKRFVVVERIADRFVESLIEQLGSRRMGDPLVRDTDVGPQAREDLRASLHRQVERSIAGGARLRLGGTIPERRGFFYPPTVLDTVGKGMPAFDEETFGPVAAVTRVGDEAEVVRVANDSTFGLGASLWTRDLARAERLAAKLEVGCVFVNGLVKSDPRLPFGGIKRSGYGRELSEYGLREFVNVKTVWFA